MNSPLNVKFDKQCAYCFIYFFNMVLALHDKISYIHTHTEDLGTHVDFLTMK